MKTIRHSAFETNSSSTHSISIDDKSTVFTSITPDKDGVIHLRGGEFGWKWERINDALTKANYCAIDAINNEDRLEMLKEVIIEHTGAKKVNIDISTAWTEDDNFYSYIDHQSFGTADVAFASKEQLKTFIFSPDSYLFTGNDNGTPPPNFYDKNPEHFSHRVVLEGTLISYFVDENIEEDKEKFQYIIECLFNRSQYYRYSEFNQVSFMGLGWTTRDSSPDYQLERHTNDGYINYKKRTVKIVHQEYNRKTEKYETIDTKFLKYQILPR